MSVAEVIARPGEDDAEVLRRAGRVESGSEHPVARAIVAAAGRRHIAVASSAGFRSTGGLGVEGVVDGDVVRVGQRDWLLAGGPRRPRRPGSPMPGAASCVGWAGRARGVVRAADARQADLGRRRSPSCASSACARCS